MKKLFLIFVIILINTQITFSIQWKVFGDLNNIRNHPQAVKISDYEAMVIGGLDNNGTGISSCEIINIKDSTIKNAANLNLGRGWFTTQQDKNGNIYAIGGLISNWDIAVNSIEKYDLLTKQWTIIGSLLNNRAIFASIFLNDSLILVVGGESDGKISINSCEIFNINTGKSRYTSNYPYQVNYHILGRTSNDEIICVGGRIGSINSARTNDIYRFDQITENWVLYGKTNSKFTNSSGLRLNKGNYIFSGGSISESPLNINNEIYKDDNNSIKFLSNMNFKRNWHKLAEFNDSTIIIAGGFDENDNNIPSSELLNTNTGISTTGPNLNNPRRTHALIALKNPKQSSNNSILCIGGGDFINSTSLASVEILQDDEEIKPNPPQITSQRFDCKRFIYTVEDANEIDQIYIDNMKSKNCKVEILTKLPSKKVDVIVSLIDDHYDGNFYIINKCTKSGLDIIIKNSISSGGYFDKLVFTDSVDYDDNIIFDTHLYGTVESRQLYVKNTSNIDITIVDVNILSKYSFSIPISQFPKLIRANSSDSINIWLEYNIVGEMLDTLVFQIDSCTSLAKSVIATGTKEDFKSIEKCGNNIKLITASIEKNRPFILSTYPNPSYGKINIEVIDSKSNNSSFDIFIEDSFGNISQIFDYSSSKISDKINHYQINDINFSSGLYKLILKNNDNFLQTNFILLK